MDKLNKYVHCVQVLLFQSVPNVVKDTFLMMVIHVFLHVMMVIMAMTLILLTQFVLNVMIFVLYALVQMVIV